MSYRSLQQCVADLERHGQLVRIDQPVDPRLEVAEIQRRIYRRGGPALLFTQVKQSRFPLVSNLFGTVERARFLFRHTWERVRRLIELKIDPSEALRHPARYFGAPWTALRMLPRRVRGGPVLACQSPLGELPGVVSWPRDGGPFITLPQVYTEDPDRPGFSNSNLGMYRVQLAGNQYRPGHEVGLHYQIHRGIGVHHSAALRRGEPLRVSVFVGGPPAMTLAAVMPLPEGLSELSLAGALAGHRIGLIRQADGSVVAADADFCLTGTVQPQERKPEGPFGDHLGYYSLAHDFPVLRVERVYHRRDAIWPLTVVGRPPQEDTTFGQLIHELTGPIIPTVLPGVRAVHAVDAAGVHPLLLAVGSERYTPYAPVARPQELLTQANAILGQGQMSLAKYLFIAAAGDDPTLDPHKIEPFLRHLLARADWRCDLHFQTCTTIDTLDYSGSGLNQGSKLVIAAVGPVRRELATQLPPELELPEGFRDPRVVLPGVLAVTAPAAGAGYRTDLDRFCRSFVAAAPLNRFAWVVLVDDSSFTARSLDNFLWVTFTRSNPAADIDGIESFTADKHWGCRGALVIDARIKPHHAPPLEEDPQVSARVDRLFAASGPLARYA